jgi:hypothetical protein
MKAYSGVDAQIHAFLTSAFGGEWSDSRLGRFTPPPPQVPNWRGDWMGFRNGLKDVEKRKISPLPGLNFDPSAAQPVASRYIDCS